MELLQHPETVVGHPSAVLACSPAHEKIPRCLRFAKLTLERVIPGNFIGSIGQILLMLNVEAHVNECFPRLLDGTHLGDTVAEFDLVGELFVLRDRGIPLVGHAPLVYTELNN